MFFEKLLMPVPCVIHSNHHLVSSHPRPDHNHLDRKPQLHRDGFWPHSLTWMAPQYQSARLLPQRKHWHGLRFPQKDINSPPPNRLGRCHGLPLLLDVPDYHAGKAVHHVLLDAMFLPVHPSSRGNPSSHLHRSQEYPPLSIIEQSLQWKEA